MLKKIMRIFKSKTKEEIFIKSWYFPAGEIGIQIDPENLKNCSEITIISKFRNSDSIFKLLLVTDILKRNEIKKINLCLPYVPYSRQDRVMNDGESLSIKVFCDLINSQNYDTVTILDPHSDVTTALLNNVKVINNHKLVQLAITNELNCFNSTNRNFYLCSPDAGAAKKIYKVSKELNKLINIKNIIVCNKNRDVSTGLIKEIYIDDKSKKLLKKSKNSTVFIIDDICDGGATFIETAKVLKESGVNRIVLIVTHGIFSKGFENLSKDIDVIYTTNSYRDISKEEYENNFCKTINIANLI